MRWRRRSGGAPSAPATSSVTATPPAQHTSIGYSDRLADVGIAASTGTVGDCDNAMAEALNGNFKAELVSLHGAWRTRRQLDIAVIEWIDWYNASRLHGVIGDRPPVEQEADWRRQHDLVITAGTPVTHIA